MLQILRRALPIVLALTAALLVAACGDSKSKDDGGSKSAKAADKLTVYSGREEELARPLYKRFEQETGIKLDVRYASSPELSATLAEEGENSPADVFYAQDSGSIGAVEGQLAPLPKATLDLVPAAYRDGKGRWTGITARVRVLAYNTDIIKNQADLPDSVLQVTGPSFKGRLGVAPTNASFLAFVSGMRQVLGDAKTLAWLKGVAANDPQIFEKNSQIIEAVSTGEVDFGLVNHYYLYELRENDPDAPVDNHYFKAGDPGNLVNVSAAGILKTSEHSDLAQKFIDFLLNEGQAYIANDAPEREYPLHAKAAGTERVGDLPPLDQITGPDVNLSALGNDLATTVELIRQSGLGV